MRVEDDAGLRRVMQNYRRIAVVGLSAKPARPSYGVAAFLLRQGYDIVPVNPAETEIFGRPCYPDLASIPGGVDMVDVFRKPDEVLAISTEAIRIGAKSVWFQLGVVNPAAIDLLLAAGLEVVVDRCLKIEHARLLD